MVGRHADNQALLATLNDRARRGVLVVGEAGVGKTFLATQLLAQIARGGVPTAHLAAVGVDDVPLGALSRVLTTHELAAGPTPSLALKRVLLGRASPTTFLIDDVDRFDGPSLLAVFDAAEAGLAKLIVTIRQDVVVPSILERALTSGALGRWDCLPLDDAATSELAAEVAGCSLTAASQRVVHHLTRGNPLYVRELLTAAAETGALVVTAQGGELAELPASSRRLGDLLEQRLRTLAPAEREAMHRIALIGDVGLAEITQFVDGDQLETLERRGLISSSLDGRRLRFEVAHPLHTEVIRSIESPLRARRIRAEHALYLQSLGARRERDRFRLATWSLDGICEVDPESLIQGARTAQATGDLVLAQRLAQAAFDAQPIIEMAELLGARQLATGDFESMKAHFARWDELVHTTAQRATYEEMFTQAWFWRGYDETMIHRLIVGLDSWPDEPSRQQAAVAASALLVSSGRIDEAVALVETVGDVTPGPTAVLAAMTLGHGWRAQGRPLAAEASVAAALDFYRSISVDAYLLSSVAMAGLHLQTLADAARFAELDRIVADNSVAWHDLGDTSNLALANLAHGYSWLVRGDYPRAVALARASAAGFERNRHPGMRRWALTLHALASAEGADLEEADMVLRQLDADRDHPAKLFAGSLERARAWVAHHRGMTDAAAERLVVAAERAAGVGNVAAVIECAHDLARQGNARKALPLVGSLPVDRLQGDLHHARLAHVHAAAASSSADLGACMAWFDRLALAHLAAECAVAAASLAATSAEAQRWLLEGQRRRVPGSTALAQRLAAAHLTPREREVAMLAAHGHTSRQMAEQLGVSHRTVETHLGKVYRKLGVEGRLDLLA